MIKEMIIMFLCMAVIVLGSVSIGYMAQDEIESLIKDIRQKDITTPEECEYLDLIETSHCLNDYIKGIFKYKNRKDIENPTLEELKQEGGDCLNWANLYVQFAENLGFYGEVLTIDIDEESAHAFASISNEDGYCILDQIKVECFNLGSSDSSLENETKTI